jgi:hypothetical protein
VDPILISQARALSWFFDQLSPRSMLVAIAVAAIVSMRPASTVGHRPE